MIRAVFDTNVLASALVGLANPERAPSRLFHLWQGQRFELVVSPEILTELRDTLATPYFHQRLSEEAIATVQLRLQEEALVVSATVEVLSVATHPEDDRVLSAAVSAAADYLVTGDRQLQAWPRTVVSISCPRRSS